MSPLTLITSMTAFLWVLATLLAQSFGDVVRFGLVAIVFAILAVSARREDR